MKKNIVIPILVGLAAIFLLTVIIGIRREAGSGAAEEKNKITDNRDLIIQGGQYEEDGKYLEAKAV